MHTMKKFLFIFLACLLAQYSFAQTPCKVAVEPLQGSYTGDCMDGKAAGQGVAIGTDKYYGSFVKGYPDGEGIYRWKDSTYYIGTFKKGKREGKGSMRYFSVKGTDSLVVGFWKKDKYVGKYEHPYDIHSTTSGVNRVSCSMVKRGGADITITTTRLHNSTSLSAGSTQQVFLGEIQVLSGRYLNRFDQSLSNSHVVTLKDVEFPFKANFIFAQIGQIQVTFFENASYSMDVNLN